MMLQQKLFCISHYWDLGLVIMMLWMQGKVLNLWRAHFKVSVNVAGTSNQDAVEILFFPVDKEM